MTRCATKAEHDYRVSEDQGQRAELAASDGPDPTDAARVKRVLDLIESNGEKKALRVEDVLSALDV